MLGVSGIKTKNEGNNMNWIKIEDQKPEEGREVFYFFDFLGVYRGQYQQIEYPKEMFKEGSEPVYGDSFFGQCGFLTDDVTHWMYTEGRGTFPDVPEGYIEITDGNHREYALEEDTVRITKREYELLKEMADTYGYLFEYGVEDWEHYEEAIKERDRVK